MIKPESIQRLIEQTDIVDVVSRYVNLKRSGR
ncbi:CHC2 zinc finger domain-containing protein, partial [Campylobacter ureolyticus]